MERVPPTVRYTPHHVGGFMCAPFIGLMVVNNPLIRLVGWSYVHYYSLLPHTSAYYIHIYTYMCVYIYIYVYVHTCVCVYIYVYHHTSQPILLARWAVGWQARCPPVLNRGNGQPPCADDMPPVIMHGCQEACWLFKISRESQFSHWI